MRINTRHLALVAVAAGAVVPTSAIARPDLGPVTHGAAAVAPCTKDYSRDSVTGGYCASDGIGVGAVAVPASAPPAPTTAVKHDNGFSWSDAGAGAGGAIALIAVAAGGTIAFRRRNPSVEPRRSAATS